MTDQIAVPDTLQDAPPSVKLVWVVLDEADEALNQSQIEDRTQLPNPTVRSALYELELTDHVDHHPDPADARRREYYLLSE